MNASKKQRRAVAVIDNYYPKQKAAAVRLLEAGLAVGDEIVIEGNTTYLRQRIRSLMKKVEALEELKKEISLALLLTGQFGRMTGFS